MNKYEAAIVLKLTRARVQRTCDRCGEAFGKGSEYFRESLGRLQKPPGFRLGSYCVPCGKIKRT
jgi:hypothetical protein